MTTWYMPSGTMTILDLRGQYEELMRERVSAAEKYQRLLPMIEVAEQQGETILAKDMRAARDRLFYELQRPSVEQRRQVALASVWANPTKPVTAKEAAGRLTPKKPLTAQLDRLTQEREAQAEKVRSEIYQAIQLLSLIAPAQPGRNLLLDLLQDRASALGMSAYVEDILDLKKGNIPDGITILTEEAWAIDPDTEAVLQPAPRRKSKRFSEYPEE